MSGYGRNWLQEGVAYSGSGRWLDAVACFRNALMVNPSDPEASFNLGAALHALGRQNDAIAAYRNAVLLKADWAQAHSNLGSIYLSLNRFEEAEASLRKALSAAPDLAQAHYHLGLVLRGLDRDAEAEACFRAACELEPPFADAWNGLRDLLASQGRTEESLQVFLEYEKHAVPSAALMVIGLVTARYLGDFERERRYLAQALEWRFQPAELMELSQLIGHIQYFDVTQEQIIAMCRRYNELASQLHSPGAPLLPPKRTKGEKIRIGYLSPDFCTHEMSIQMLEAISRHDTEQFEVYLYSLLPSAQDDELPGRLGGLVHKLMHLAPWTEQQAARIIAEDDLDVLVDLAGHSANSRPLILAYKPARVQIAHPGYRSATGLEAVDFRLTDQCADRPDNQNYSLEKLLPLEGCMLPLARVAPAPEHPYRRESFGIAADAVVFGEFVALWKLSPRCLDVWRSILERVPNGVLAFSPTNQNDGDSFMRQAGAAGIKPDRVVFIPYEGSVALQRARYQLVDIVLDTFPYSGGVTTLAALDMGVPVVALCGERHSERMSYSILTHTSLKETIAFSVEEFVEIACKLAGNQALREKMRESVREGVEHYGVADMDAYARRLESAYRRALDAKGWNLLAQGFLTAAELKELLHQAIVFHQARLMDDAERIYRKLLEDQPELPSANYLYARLLAERGNTAAAIKYLRRATVSHPRFGEAFQALGEACLEQADFAGAIAAFQQVLVLQPDQPQGLLGLAQAMMQSKRADEGKAMLWHLLNLAVANPDLQFRVGLALQRAGLLKEAGAVYNRALVLHPADWRTHFNMGVIYHEQAQPKLAANHFYQVIGLRRKEGANDPRWDESLLAAGEVEMWMENFRRFGHNA